MAKNMAKCSILKKKMWFKNRNISLLSTCLILKTAQYTGKFVWLQLVWVLLSFHLLFPYSHLVVYSKLIKRST